MPLKTKSNNEIAFNSNLIPESKRKNRVFKISGIVSIFVSIIYIFLYSLIPANPDYGDHASTSSNVGKDHTILFTLWGILLGIALLINIYYLLQKFNITSKFPKVMTYIALVGMSVLLIFKNDKFQRYELIFNKNIYKGSVRMKTEKYLGTNELIKLAFTKKDLHTIGAVIFGFGIAFALLYCLFKIAHEDKRLIYLPIVFIGYIFVAGFFLKTSLSGLTEAIIIDVALVLLFVLNFIQGRNKNKITELKK